MKTVYLDNSATTELSKPVKDKMLYVMNNIYGNPSSLHAKGLEAEKVLSAARENILASLGVRDFSKKTLIFTGSGTEADNLILTGVCTAKSRPVKKRIVVSDSEHPAILETAARLEKSGVEVVRLSTVGGEIDLDEVKNAVNADTVLISVMLVNNETGAVYNVREIFELAKRINPYIVTHTDAVQGYLKIPFAFTKSGADAVTLSSHKIHGPKGVGALVVDNSLIRTKRLVPIIYGGGQEGGFRSGTENVIGIAGMGEAALSAMNYEYVSGIKNKITELLDGFVKFNLPQNSAPHILSITLPKIKSETMLHFLSQKNIYVSSGSACSSKSGHVSKTLLAYGLDASAADSTIRVSLDDSITEEDAELFAQALKEGIERFSRK